MYIYPGVQLNEEFISMETFYRRGVAANLYVPIASFSSATTRICGPDLLGEIDV